MKEKKVSIKNTKEKKQNNENKNENKLSNQMSIELMLIALAIYVIMLYCYDAIPYTSNIYVQSAREWLYLLLRIAPALLVYKLQGKKIKELFIVKKGFWITTFILFTIVVLPSLISNVITIFLHTDEDAFMLITYKMVFLEFLKAYFVTAVSEEFMFRIFMQGTLADVLGKYKVLAPVLTALTFASVHLIHVDLVTFFFAMFFGIVMGYARLYNDKISFVSCVLVHGSHNFVSTVFFYLIYLLH